MTSDTEEFRRSGYDSGVCICPGQQFIDFVIGKLLIQPGDPLAEDPTTLTFAIPPFGDIVELAQIVLPEWLMAVGAVIATDSA